MFRRIYVDDFLSLVRLDLELGDRPLLGRNGTGKSSLFRASRAERDVVEGGRTRSAVLTDDTLTRWQSLKTQRVAERHRACEVVVRRPTGPQGSRVLTAPLSALAEVWFAAVAEPEPVAAALRVALGLDKAADGIGGRPSDGGRPPMPSAALLEGP
jgi:hypothetical protein